MFYINYDLVRQIVDERRTEAMTRATRRRARTHRAVSPREVHPEVIELEFGAHCETERIGA